MKDQITQCRLNKIIIYNSDRLATAD